MAQSITHACTNCGIPVPANMRFCPNCGAPSSASNSPPSAGGYERTQLAPPPPQAAYTGYPPQTPQGQQGYQAPMPNPLPAYAQPQKNSAGRVGRQIGCGLGIILLLGVLILSAAGFFAFRYITGRSGNIANTGANSEVTPTQAPLTTTPINATFNYASVNITIINAQRATSFADDRDTPAHGVVRLNLHAVQSDVNSVYQASNTVFVYPESFALLLPGGSKVALGGYKEGNGPARKGDQTTWIDFPAATGLKVEQMILQIGKDTEEQIQVPLTGHADLSQYQPKQSTPNLRVPCGSMFWTLKTVTFKLSDSGTQVEKGKRFLVLTLSIDNPSTEGLVGYPPDFMRLQYGGTIIAADQSVIGNVAASTTSVPGLVSFLVPQDTTMATFILLPEANSCATTQVTIPFPIP